MLMVIAEKSSAAKSFANALGGMSGTFDGKKYKIVSSVGHLLQFKEPHEMVHEDYHDEFKSWNPKYLPWDITQMNWAKRPGVTYNPRTKSKSTHAAKIKEIKQALTGVTGVVIATDIDASGEGQLIGWEVIDAIGWKGPVFRLEFVDEGISSLQNGFKNMKTLPVKSKDGEFVKADTRSKWDFISMQLTRISTSVARQHGYPVVVRQGRLKSVIVSMVKRQLDAYNSYKRTPFYEARYKDDKGNVFSRKYTEDSVGMRHATEALAAKDVASFYPSDVVVDSQTQKASGPGALLDLAGLSGILASKGYKPKEVLATYQKMYEKQIVSYPRTDDKTITLDQFKEMLPLVDSIAGVVGVDISLLTHRQPRKSHVVKSGGAHGANRPGVSVPSNLSSLSQYGPSAEAIYTTLANNFLAMFGENYIYNSIKAHIKDHPSFTSTISVPVSMGYKAIFDADAESKDEDADGSGDSKGVGSKASSFVFEGANKRPTYPTMKWVMGQLKKYDVGTGATRTSALAEITEPNKTQLLSEKRGRLDVTDIGKLSAILLEGSNIANVEVTEQLFTNMGKVGRFEMSAQSVIDSATAVVQHDKDVFIKNGAKLHAILGKPKKGLLTGGQGPMKEKVTGMHKGKEITFNREWGGHDFTDQEVDDLLAGKTITFSTKGKYGLYTVSGLLAEKEYNGSRHWGFQKKDVPKKSAHEYTAADAPFKPEWSGYKFKKSEEAKLRAGEKVKVKAISAKTGKPFEVDVSFGIQEYNGDDYWKIIPHFKKR